GRSGARTMPKGALGGRAEQVIDLLVGRALVDPAYEAWLTARVGDSTAEPCGAGHDPHLELRRFATLALSRVEHLGDARPGIGKAPRDDGPPVAVLPSWRPRF